MQDSFIFEGKKYISARRASEISDYSSDYIGQLCRGGKIDCRMIGRSWFVTEESLHLHKANVLHDEISRNRIQNLRGGKKQTVTAIETVDVPTKKVADVSTQKMAEAAATIDAPESSASQLTYSADERPLMPVVERTLYKKQDEIEEHRSSHVLSLDAENNIYVGNSANAKAAPEFSDARDSVITNTDSEAVGVEPNISAANVATYPEIARGLILRRVIRNAAIPVFAIAVFAVIAWNVSSGNQSGSLAAGETGASGGSSSANVMSAVEGIFSAIHDTYNSILAAFDHSQALTVNTPDQTPSGTSSDAPVRGIAVVPSTGSSAGDAAVKQEIQNQFSDQVDVTPDQSGTAGVIKPVFKDVNGKNYVYVMVPINNASSTRTR